MFCVECGNPLPEQRDSSTVCSKCKTPVATWWDEASGTYRTHREYLTPYAELSALQTGSGGGPLGSTVRENVQSIEERHFQAALISVELHFERRTELPKTSAAVKQIITKTLDLSLNRTDVRECLAKNVDIWMRLNKIFILALPTLEVRSLRESYAEDGAPQGPDLLESANLIICNYDALVQDLNTLNHLLVISRNMLAIKETAQEICAAVRFDKAVREIIVLCVNVTSKGHDGETVDEVNRGKLNDVAELYKKLLVTSLQHMHNWTMGHDRFKMSFWFEMLFDNDLRNDTIHEFSTDDLDVERAYHEVGNWLQRSALQRDRAAAEILSRYSADAIKAPMSVPGPLPKDFNDARDADAADDMAEAPTPVWKPDLEDKFEQDRLYARVSHELDVWWKRCRDANYDGWVVPMESVEGAVNRANACKENALHRYMHEPGPQYASADGYDDGLVSEEGEELDEIDDRSMAGNVGQPDEADEEGVEEEEGDEEEEDEEEEEEDDDDDSYIEGPLRGLLTEIPNILDTKQIEALHMTVKACIVDSMGSGLTPAGENLQKTRCKMFLALDCGKNLLRELLVFIAVWEQTDQQFIFQITAQIIESFHHNALLPFAWNSLRILKDIVSPAQTVLLRLISYMFRARKDSPIYDDIRDYNRDAKLIHFLYNYFRCRVVPDCIALIYAQAQIRQGVSYPSDFPVDLWDMERAKDGLAQYLDLISVVAEIPEMRPLLIEWEAVYEMVSLLKQLEGGVARKGIDELNYPSRHDVNHAPAPLDPHKFPWAGIKIQILIILTHLVAPSNARRQGPGNPTVQQQLLDYGGILPLLNCCVYDGHNEYLKERATLTIKYVMEGCEKAQKFVRDLVPIRQAQQEAEMSARGARATQAHAHAQANAHAHNQTHAHPRRSTMPPPPLTSSSQLSAAQQFSTLTASEALLAAQELERKTRELRDQGLLSADMVGSGHIQGTSGSSSNSALVLEEARELILQQARGHNVEPAELERMTDRLQELKADGKL